MSAVFGRATAILDFIAQGKEPVGVTTISRALDLPKPSVSRLLAMLREYNFVIRNKDGLFQMGPAALLWANGYTEQKGLAGLCRPYMEALQHEINETIHLFTYEGGKLYYLLRLHSDRPVSTRFSVGQQPALHCTGGGKAILMSLPEPELMSYLNQPMEAKTTRSVTNKLALLEEFARFKAQGYSEEIGEHEPDIRCVGAPLIDSLGYPVGAISVAAASYRFSDADALRTGKRLSEIAKEISLILQGKK